MYVCDCCADECPENCGHFDRANLKVMPDGTWLCDGCYDEADLGAYGVKRSEDGWPTWGDMPNPPEYGPINSQLSE